jgi:hypothetical protein
MPQNARLPVAQFEEKEYEIAAAVELALGAGSGGMVYAVGQVLEKLVGYDSASDPMDTNPIWAVLEVPRPPGIRLVPSLWLPGKPPPASRLPSRPISLILQYKRPTYLRGHAAKQWRQWEAPYFRFERTRDQQTVLARLERKTGKDVVVRYAAPAFWRRYELEGVR